MRLTGKSDVPTPERISNPRPEPGDILLPMPGGLRMALRPVCVPASGRLEEVSLPFGIVGASQEDGDAISEAWTDRRYTAPLNGSFDPGDIPAAWEGLREWIAADPAAGAQGREGIRSFLYFIGKYEVTRGQWRAVMETDGPFTPRAGDDRPMTDISWFEATEFSRRYSEWLMSGHPEVLPFFRQERRSAFIRLPTEAEWEFAARGGHRVSPAERERTRLHPAPQDADMGEYIIAAQYDSTLTGPAAVGSRKANPLGLFDILGNCAEMVQTPFQMVASGRLLGSQGGFVIKGGSWRAHSASHLHPGRRIEADYYVDGRAHRRDDLGFRVSLGSILSPKDRKPELQEEWERKSAPQAAGGGPDQDVRVVIREVVREVESPELRRRLAEAEDIASRYHAQVNAGEERMIRETLLGAAFSLETIANYASRCHQLIRLMDARSALASGERKETDILKEIRGFVLGMRGALHYYRGMLASISGTDERRILRQMEALRVQFAHDDGFSRSMGRRLDALRRHVDAGLIRGVRRPDEQDLRDLLPDWLMTRLMEYWKTVS